MATYENESITGYANEMPSEIRRAMKAMSGDIGLAAFLVLFKYGELSFSQIMNELEIPQEYSSQLTYHIKKLQKAGLVKNEYIKKEDDGRYSFYGVTEFGGDFVNNLMNAVNSNNNTKKCEDKTRLLQEPEACLEKTNSVIGRERGVSNAKNIDVYMSYVYSDIIYKNTTKKRSKTMIRYSNINR